MWSYKLSDFKYEYYMSNKGTRNTEPPGCMLKHVIKCKLNRRRASTQLFITTTNYHSSIGTGYL